MDVGSVWPETRQMKREITILLRFVRPESDKRLLLT
jgi:hypothetical protein